MGTAVLELPRELFAPVVEEVGSLGAFFETSPSSDQILGSNEERLLRALICALDRRVLAVISARSVGEFARERRKAWPKYIRSLRALQNTFSNLVPPAVMEQGSIAVIAELESDFEKKGEVIFGVTLRNQALFTLWTIGKMRLLAREIIGVEVPASKREQDMELASDYHLHSLWAQFHLDSLIVAMKFDRPVCDEIREEVCDGLRAVVNAYAVMKDAVDLRRPSSIESATPANLPWDEEDERLLAASMRDRNADTAQG